MIGDLDLERNQRMLLAEGGDLARQEIERQRLTACDSYRAAAQPLEVLDVGLHALGFALVAAQVVDEDFAGSGELYAARPPVEQRRAELLLKVGNPAIDRGCRDVQPLGGLSYRPGARHLIDVTQYPQMLHDLEVLHDLWALVVPFQHQCSK